MSISKLPDSVKLGFIQMKLARQFAGDARLEAPELDRFHHLNRRLSDVRVYPCNDGSPEKHRGTTTTGLNSTSSYALPSEERRNVANERFFM